MDRELQITCFGAPILVDRSQPQIGTLRGKALALFVYLAVTGRVHTRDRLADLLWSELSNQQARNNLRYLLSDLRQVVGDYLVVTPQTIGFNRQGTYWLDVEFFRTTLNADAATTAIEQRQQALDLYQGEFLAGFSVRNAPLFDAWVLAQQEELHREAVQGLLQIAQHYLAVGKLAAGIQNAQRLLTYEPWHEAGHYLLMQLLVADGQRAAALAQYQQLQRLLQEEIGVAPTAATSAFYRQIRCGEASPPAPLPKLGKVGMPLSALAGPAVAPRAVAQQPTLKATLPDLGLVLPLGAPVKHNLPRPLTPLMGRQMELAALHTKLLDPAYPLLALVGEGGIGKTRLALSAAHALVDAANQRDDRDWLRDGVLLQPTSARHPFCDGIWFVSLTRAASGAGLPERLASAIGEVLQLAFGGSESLCDQLLTTLRHKQLLLILDNFEQFHEGADFVLTLLQRAPGIKVLITSRRQLALQAEYAWRLDGLNFPTPEEAADQDIQALLAYDGIALFVERARRAQPTFQFDQENRAEIVRICQALDGVPLSLELAATLVNAYNCAQIVAALAESYQILTTSLPDIPAYHRSLQTVLTCSWQLLSPQETAILARCAVFQGGFTLDAAMMITGATESLLISLLNHSLVIETRDSAGQVRYQLHEMVRQYAAEQLQQMGTLARQTYEQHCTYYTALLAKQETALQATAYARYLIQADLDNIRAAWQWAVAAGRIDALAQSLGGLSAFYEVVGFYQEAQTLLEQTRTQLQHWLPQAAAQGQATLRELLGRCLLEEASVCLQLDQAPHAAPLAQYATQIGEQIQNQALRADGRRRLAMAYLAMGHLTTAGVLLAESVALARQANRPRLIALGLQNLALWSDSQANADQALAYGQEALALVQLSQEQRLASSLAHHLGMVSLTLGQWSQALFYWEQAIGTSRDLGWQRVLAAASLNASYLLTTVGEFLRAQHAAEEALALFIQVGCRREQVRALTQLGVIAHRVGDEEKAYLLGIRSLEIAEVENYPEERAIALVELANTLVIMQRWPEAEHLYEQALASWQAMENNRQVTLARTELAFLYFQQEKLFQAQALVAQILPELDHITTEGARIYWVCYHVLAQGRDPRAALVLQQGSAFLQRQSARIEDEQLRRSFLEKVAVNRQLLALAYRTRSAKGSRAVAWSVN
ncbi:MAG: hypothetical protein KF832_25930 [Caldilineaceae bacterium]|nr:hypothetical protein [Caldilineaceae bacterium]